MISGIGSRFCSDRGRPFAGRHGRAITDLVTVMAAVLHDTIEDAEPYRRTRRVVRTDGAESGRVTDRRQEPRQMSPLWKRLPGLIDSWDGATDLGRYPWPP